MGRLHRQTISFSLLQTSRHSRIWALWSPSSPNVFAGSFIRAMLAVTHWNTTASVITAPGAHIDRFGNLYPEALVSSYSYYKAMATEALNAFAPRHGYGSTDCHANSYNACGYPDSYDQSYGYGYSVPPSQAHRRIAAKEGHHLSARTFTQPQPAGQRSNRHRESKMSSLVSISQHTPAYKYNTPSSPHTQALPPPSSAKTMVSVKTGFTEEDVRRRPGYVPNMPPPDYFVSGASRRDAVELAWRGVGREQQQGQRRLTGPGSRISASVAEVSSRAESVVSRGRQRTRGGRAVAAEESYMPVIHDGYVDDHVDPEDAMTASVIGPEESISQVSVRTVRSRRSHKKEGKHHRGLAPVAEDTQGRDEMLLLEQWWGEDEQPYFDQGNGYWLRNVRPGYIVR